MVVLPVRVVAQIEPRTIKHDPEKCDAVFRMHHYFGDSALNCLKRRKLNALSPNYGVISVTVLDCHRIPSNCAYFGDSALNCLKRRKLNALSPNYDTDSNTVTEL